MNQLAECKEATTHVEPTLDHVGAVVTGNGTGALGALQPLVASDDEAWISEIAFIGSHYCTQVRFAGEDEEAAILSHPDVVAAVAEGIDDFEAWERSL